MSARPRFQAVCLVCYHCELTVPTTKRNAERAATSHVNAYKHNVTVLRVKETPDAGPSCVSSETAYGRTVAYPFALKVF